MTGIRERSVAEAQALWHAETIYLNTASFGLPPDPVWDALQQAQGDWRAGRVSWEHWTAVTGRARAQYATLVGADVDRVAVGSTVSGLIAQVAAALPAGSRVLSTEPEFVSLLFPFLAQEGRGVTVEVVPVDRLAEAIDATTDVVAVSAVQSSTGEVAALDDIAAAAAHHGAMTVVDATHAIGWLPLDASRFDAVACACYKWLMCPRGTAFLVLSERLSETMTPHQAGWFAANDPLTDQFGPPLRLPETARRFDTSPAWFSWVGTEPALALINEIGVGAIHDHDLALANRFRAGLGLEPSNSAIVSTAFEGATDKLARAGIMAAARAGKLRASFHLYNTEADVDAALSALLEPGQA
ncbi:aminotransferase class V-fold PLP-dependent enzyme [Solirubrobacter ginsenosidimutans]|uniref:Aminotransferase class V-fold PLP-dependent enzyme n=1 Tax=Solirubrobacter ginsenosidimutans TaxID=490573 RepID=A0A9X3S9B5_9ACTN|nr:aminotransferase class V-fold PLP-dependent enzyme [Solirubrobacter ginsenosidimutans]MDA0164803.1 aminotransferase class V-fold PLP-dependent enzyme [Solirubrobacter ginsenosidimutans]